MSLVSSIAKESYFPDDGRVLIGKKIEKGTSSIRRSWINLTNNEIKDITKVINSFGNKPLKNRILLKGTTRKITQQKGRFFDFFRPLMTTGLPFK